MAGWLARAGIEASFRVGRGLAFLAVAALVYWALHSAGIWYPEPVSDYQIVALACALVIAFGRRFPLFLLVSVSVIVGNPLWDFQTVLIRVIPLVLAAFLSANAGLSIAVALPVAAAAALASQFPRWIMMVPHPDMWWEFVRNRGMSLPIMVCGVVVAAVLLGAGSYRQSRSAASLREQNEELVRLRESDRERIANEERTAIAREVHDVVAHHMAAIVVRAQAAAKVAERNPAEPLAAVQWIADAGPKALAEMRGLVRLLRGDEADRGARATETLAGAIEAVIERVRAAGIDVRADIDVPVGLTALQEFAVLRVCQEALTNVLVHSHATSASVRLFMVDGDAVLTVEDDGAGEMMSRTPPKVGQTTGDGSGLRGMRERATAAGGFVTAGPSDAGWRVRLVVPLRWTRLPARPAQHRGAGMTEDATKAIRVMVVDDQPMVRMGLAMMVDAEPDLRVVGSAGDGNEAVALARELRPDVILMDVRMPRMDGIAATREIMTAGTAGAIVVVTTFDDEQYLLDGVRAGASGFLLKDAGPELIATGIRSAHAGDALIDPSMTRSLLEQRLRHEIAPGSGEGPPASAAARMILDALSPREKEVLAALARGASNAEIAKELWLGEATVKTHLSNLLTKTGTTNRVQAAVFAYESGFLRPGWLRSAPERDTGSIPA
jgi:DNA-binding NarL/FixJ family response regulator/signal transduction histidine kinase